MSELAYNCRAILAGQMVSHIASEYQYGDC